MSPPSSSPSPSPAAGDDHRILDDVPVEVAVIGSGVCGVLAAATLRERDGARVRVLEASPEGAGGVWRTTANSYSTLQVRVLLRLSSIYSHRKRREEKRKREKEGEANTGRKEKKKKKNRRSLALSRRC